MYIRAFDRHSVNFIVTGISRVWLFRHQAIQSLLRSCEREWSRGWRWWRVHTWPAPRASSNDPGFGSSFMTSSTAYELTSLARRRQRLSRQRTVISSDYYTRGTDSNALLRRGIKLRRAVRCGATYNFDLHSSKGHTRVSVRA